jgi:Domain of unknown function (DUF4157)
MTDAAPSIETLGLRLTDQARRVAARWAADCAWAGPVEVLLDHLTSLPAQFEGRFERREVSPRPGTRWSLGASGPAGGERGTAVTAARPAVSPGRPLPADVVERLRAVAGPGVESMRVHDDEAAHATAQAHRADAVTVGPDVFFREERFRPRDPLGFRLLVHEASHVLERLRPGASWRRATAAGVREEEARALARESAALARGPAAPARQPAALGQGPAALGREPAAAPGPAMARAPDRPPTGPLATPASTASRPMAAAADREVDQPAPAPVDLDALRSSLVRDLMRQLRDEFERGG